MKPRLAIGFKAHTGWAAAVVIGEGRGEPSGVAKGRITMLETFARAAVYHQALEGNLTADQARPLIDAAFRDALARAKEEIAKLAADRARAVIISRNGPPLPPLESIIRSHPLVHAAEGELYRDVVARACESMGMETVRVPAKKLPKMPAALAAAGAASGPPWAADQKACAVAAWSVLLKNK